MKLRKLDKIRLVLLLPLSLSFIVLGSIILTRGNDENNQNLGLQLNTNIINTETKEIEALNTTPQPSSTTKTNIDNNTTKKVEETITPSPENLITSLKSALAVTTETGEQKECEPMKDYCTSREANLLNDVDFPGSHDGSFENPICTLQPDGSVSGKGCSSVNDLPTHYQADMSILIPVRSQVFYQDGGNYQKPEYVRQEVAGEQQCLEKLTAHGNNSFKIFTRQGHAIKGGICLPIKPSNGSIYAGINYRVSQATEKSGGISSNVPVTVKLGFINTQLQNDTYSTTSLSINSITWVTSKTITSNDYSGDSAKNQFEARYAGGFLSSNFPSNAKGLCFMIESPENGQGINSFWDGAFASSDSKACENSVSHSDGIDRTCGGYACTGVDPTYSGNYYTDFDQKYYAFDIPAFWNANQCHYETTSNGAKSPYGTLFVGLDLNSCDLNYKDVAQKNLHPSWRCSDNRNWTYGYAWTGGIKDFGLLQYLDCAMGTLEDESFKGTKANPFFCSQILKAYSNTSNIFKAGSDEEFTIRYSNTYPGLVSAIQAEGNRNFWKVPLLGSAIGTGVINNKQVDKLSIDPFLIGKRNSGSGLNNKLKFNLGDLADYIITKHLRTEEHLYEGSIIPKSEVMIEDLLAKGPVCTNIEGDPIRKIHYGREDGTSDRAIFGFADDEGSLEHIIDESNIEITPEELCNYQFRDNRVVGATCTFKKIGEGRNVTFTEGNINNTLEQEGFVRKLLIPTLPPPNPSGIPVPGYNDCPEINLCGKDFGCGGTMRQLYDACISNREVDEIGGNPFIRYELPNGWKNLQIHGLNKLLEATWLNEFNQYNQVIRHENVGIDVNQVVSIYDEQQPKCTALGDDRKPSYCSDDPVINKASQICRRTSPYDCGCNPNNFTTCLLNCPALFKKPDEVASVGLELEGKETSSSVRSILENDNYSFLKRFVKILSPKTYEGDGAKNYTPGQVYQYNSEYTGGFLLANTGSGKSQCTSDTSSGSKTGVSQVRLENYYAYIGQVPRMNERIGFAATNNKDPDSVIKTIIDTKNVSSLILAIVKGGALDDITLPYCDVLIQSEDYDCATTKGKTCDCLVRSCQEIKDSKIKLTKKYLPVVCKQIMTNNQNSSLPDDYDEQKCYDTVSKTWFEMFENAYNSCINTPKTNENFNCDPMANYLISQGFDSPQLRMAACDKVAEAQMCSYEKFGVHLITGPVQESNYSRAENLGLKWKMEVITKNSSDMISAMVSSVNSFSGNTIFRFCNADKGTPGSLIQDPDCDFRTEITGSPENSGKLVAKQIMAVAEKTTKTFYVSPINEPNSEQWYAINPKADLNDPSFKNTMKAVSMFYKTLFDELNTNTNIRNKVKIGGPTYNITAFGNYQNFERFHNEFTSKDSVDYWTANIYNYDDFTIESQFDKVKEVFNDGKPIGINEIGDFEHQIQRLKSSLSQIGPDSRLKYALLFNAFGGWGDLRGEVLELTDTEILEILLGNRYCVTAGEACYIDKEGGGGTIQANPLPFGYNFTSVYDQLIPPGTPGGRTCTTKPPKAGDYYSQSDIGMSCPGYDTRKKMDQYDFYRGALKTCGIEKKYTHWDSSAFGSNIETLKATILAKNITYHGWALKNANKDNLTTILAKSKTANRNPMIVISIWATESGFGLSGNNFNEFNCGTGKKTFEESLNCVLELSYFADKTLDEIVDTYGPFCDNETYAKRSSSEGGGELICPEPGEGLPITTPECFVSPLNKGFRVSQCFGNTKQIDSTNKDCMNIFNPGLSGYTYELGEFHSGIDLTTNGATSSDDRVYASASGKVTEVYYSNKSSGYGNNVVIEHKMNNSSSVYYTRYAHLDAINVKKGDDVTINTQIGVMGNTGRSDFKHLHFEIANLQGPTSYLVGNKSTLQDPTKAIQKDRTIPNEACSSSVVTNPVDNINLDGVSQFNINNLIVLRIDKNKYSPSIEWNNNPKTLRNWANSLNAQIFINASLFESGSYRSSGRLKIRNSVIQSIPSPQFANSSGQGYLSFNTNDFSINESTKLNLNEKQNILESLPILILNGRKYTSNNSVVSRNTSIGYDNSGNFIIVIAPKEGQYSYSAIADIMLNSGLNLNSLLNLDGGGSTGLIVKGTDIDYSTNRLIPGIMTFSKK